MDRTLLRAASLGAVGFGLASALVFATVAFAEGWMYKTLGPGGAYVVWTVLFIGLGGGALSPLAPKAWRGLRFLRLFALAFFLYAAGWCAGYFGLSGVLGEWLGALAGAAAMGQVFVIAFRVRRTPWRLGLILFVANVAGYFPGSTVHDVLGRPTGMVLWGVLYGVFLGAGLGAVLHLAPRQADAL